MVIWGTTGMIVEAVRRYYVERWGEPSKERRFSDSEGNGASVLKWRKDSTEEGVAIYATLGASERPLESGNPKHRLEVFLGLEPEKDDIMEHLALAATYPTLARTSIDHGDTIRFQEGLWQGSPMSVFLLVQGIGEVLPPLALQDGLHVDFLQAVPVFDYELRFKKSYGISALVERWRQTGAPFWNPDRRPESGRWP